LPKTFLRVGDGLRDCSWAIHVFQDLMARRGTPFGRRALRSRFIHGVPSHGSSKRCACERSQRALWNRSFSFFRAHPVRRCPCCFISCACIYSGRRQADRSAISMPSVNDFGIDCFSCRWPCKRHSCSIDASPSLTRRIG
jgi:hypothetical protein